MADTTCSVPAGIRRVASVEGLLDVLDAGRIRGDGDTVDLLTHGLQCAAALERLSPRDLELQVAGLVHDVGSIVAPGDAAHHAATGAALVRPILGPRVADLVAGHDLAKRYLLTVDARYRDRLSPRSRATLRYQGGLLDPSERSAFAVRPEAETLLVLRRADDGARVPEARVSGLEHWSLALHALAARAGQTRSNR